MIARTKPNMVVCPSKCEELIQLSTLMEESNPVCRVTIPNSASLLG